MKKIRLVLLAAIAILSVGISSCQKDDFNIKGRGDITMEWIDMGLPSGLQWGTENVGAYASEVDAWRYYFAWGETMPKKAYFWETYKYGTVDATGALATLTKYNTLKKLGKIDNLTSLKPKDDAATAALGNGARTPTSEEWQELLDNTTNGWATLNGVNGWMFISAKGDTLFMPAAGYYEDSVCYKNGKYGRYWSSSLVSAYPDDAMIFRFGMDDVTNHSAGVYGSRRYYGYSVRPVRSK